MKKLRFTPVDYVIGAYVLLPIFFRLGPVSVYQLLIIGILAFCFITAGLSQIRLNVRVSWLIRATLLLVTMLYHREISAIIVYVVTPGLLGMLLCTYVKQECTIDRLIDVLICSSIINFAICIIEYFTEVNLSYLLCTDGTAFYVPLTREGQLRVFGAFVNPINNGIFCIFILILCLYRIERLSSAAGKRIMWAIYACNWLVIILTDSRAVMMIGVAANAFLLCKLYYARIKRYLPIIGLIVLAILVTVVILYAVNSPLTDKINGIILPFLQIFDDLLGTSMVDHIAGPVEVHGVGNRLDLYKWVPAVMDNVYFGEGRDANFGKAVWEHLRRNKHSIENQYLSELYRHGVIALCGKIVLFVSTLIYSLRWAIKEWRRKQTGLNTFLLTAFAAYFIILFTVAQNEERKVFYILVMLQALHNTFAQEKEPAVEKGASMKQIKIVLFGTTLQSGNKGCEALAYSLFNLINDILRRHDMTAKVFSVVYLPYGQTLDRDLSAFDRIEHTFLPNRKKNLRAQKAIVDAVWNCDLCIDLTDGDSFSDIYGKSRFYWRTAEKAFVLLCGKKLLLGPQTYGPYKSNGAKRFAAWVLKRAKYVYSRDEKSAALVKELTGRDIPVTTDLAFQLPRKIHEQLPGDTRRIGINISGLLWNGGYTGDNQFGLTVDYRDYVIRLIRWCLEEKQMQVYLIPHVITLNDENNPENDRKVCRQIQEMFPQCRVVEDCDNPMVLKGYISQMDVFTGARMHSTIGAFSSGVATIPFAYSKKFGDLFGTVDYPYLIDGRVMTTEEAFEKSCSYINDATVLTERVRQSIVDVMERADRFAGALEKILIGEM